MRHTGRVVRGLGIFEVAPAGQQAEFRWTELLDLPWPLSGRLMRAAIVPVARRGLGASLGRLARLVLSGCPAGLKPAGRTGTLSRLGHRAATPVSAASVSSPSEGRS